MGLFSKSSKVGPIPAQSDLVSNKNSTSSAPVEGVDVKALVRSVFDGKANPAIDDTRNSVPTSSMRDWEKKAEIEFSLKMYNYIKTGEMFSRVNLKTDSMSEEELDAVINEYRSALDITDNRQDGIVGSFKQGTIGDCGFLSSLKVIASTKEGAKIIDDSIKKNHDDTYSVRFLGEPGKVYNVSEKELAENNEFSTGDKDVKILEIAANKWRMETKKKSLEGIEYPEVKKLITGSDYKFYAISSSATIRPKEAEGSAIIVDKKEFLKNIPEGRFFFADMIKFVDRHGYFVEKKKDNLLLFDPSNTVKDPQITSIDEFVNMKDTEIIY